MNDATCQTLCGTCPWCHGFIAGAATHLEDTSDTAERIERWANARGANVVATAHNKYESNTMVVRVRIGDELVDIRQSEAKTMLIRGMHEPHDMTHTLVAVRAAGIR